MGRSVKITKANALQIQKALKEFERRVGDVEALVQKYPVECRFGGYRFVLTSQKDVQDLVEALRGKLKRYAEDL